jgi:membrane-bound lytic murein transglycosylase D
MFSFSKKKYSIVFLCFAFNVNCTVAQQLNNAPKKIAENINKEISYTTVPENVVYPSQLESAKEETIEYIENFAKSRKDYVIRMHNKGKSSFPKIIKIFKKHNVLSEYKVLIALESAFNANATSPVGAVGYWQIMDEVAKEYGLNYIPFATTETTKTPADNKAKDLEVKKPVVVDDRRNFLKSTQTAARYLKDRGRNLNNNMLLIVASYNCGVGNVWKAIKKSGKPNASFWDIKQFLPTETKNYVMNFITLNVLFHNYDKFTKNTLTFKPVKVKVDESEKNTARLN